jgi:hypothetical protein
LLAMYGDHLPSFPRTFQRVGFHDSRSDYLLWRAGNGTGARRDLAAHDLGRTILEARSVPPVPQPVPFGLRQAAT